MSPDRTAPTTLRPAPGPRPAAHEPAGDGFAALLGAAERTDGSGRVGDERAAGDVRGSHERAGGTGGVGRPDERGRGAGGPDERSGGAGDAAAVGEAVATFEIVPPPIAVIAVAPALAEPSLPIAAATPDGTGAATALGGAAASAPAAALGGAAATAGTTAAPAPFASGTSPLPADVAPALPLPSAPANASQLADAPAAGPAAQPLPMPAPPAAALETAPATTSPSSATPPPGEAPSPSTPAPAAGLPAAPAGPASSTRPDAGAQAVALPDADGAGTTGEQNAAPREPVAPAQAPAPVLTPLTQRAASLHQAPRAVAQVLQVAVERERSGDAGRISHARLNLRPAELGGIEIRLQTSAAGVTAQVIADSPEAARLLHQAADDLRRSLERHDVTLLSLDVSTAGDGRPDGSAGASADLAGDRARHFAAHGLTPPPAAEADEPPAVVETLQLPDGVHVDVLA